MVIAVHSNASYLSKPLPRSRVGGHFFCSSNVDDPPNNGAVLNISKIFKAVMSIAAEAKLGALYINACEAIPMQHLLEEMGLKQPQLRSNRNGGFEHQLQTPSRRAGGGHRQPA
jgi:hypothetical protein